MRKPRGPCEGCQDRTPENPETGQQDCHKTCEKYADFKKAIEEYHKEVRDRIRQDMALTYRPWRHKRGKDADKE